METPSGDGSVRRAAFAPGSTSKPNRPFVRPTGPEKPGSLEEPPTAGTPGAWTGARTPTCCVGLCPTLGRGNSTGGGGARHVCGAGAGASGTGEMVAGGGARGHTGGGGSDLAMGGGVAAAGAALGPPTDLDDRRGGAAAGAVPGPPPGLADHPRRGGGCAGPVGGAPKLIATAAAAAMSSVKIVAIPYHATWGLTPAVFILVPVRLKWLYWAIFDPAFPTLSV